MSTILAVYWVKNMNLFLLLALISHIFALPIEHAPVSKRDTAPKTCNVIDRLAYIEKGLRKHFKVFGLDTDIIDIEKYHFWSKQAWINFNVMESMINAYVMYGDKVIAGSNNKDDNMISFALDKDIDNILTETLWKKSFGSFGTDDHGWRILMGLAFHNYYQLKGKGDEWLVKARDLFESNMANYWDSSGPGGVFWKEKQTGYRATISTELYLTIAAKLYDANNANKTYLNDAIKAYDFLYSIGLKSSDGIFGDGYDVKDDGTLSLNSKEYYTYNQGTILSGLGLLYKHTKNDTYLQSGLDLIGRVFSSGNMSDGLVLADKCDKTTISTLQAHNLDKSNKIEYCNEDRSYFKGAFLKHMTYFFKNIPSDKSRPFHHFVQANANTAWNASLNNDNNGFSNVWIGQNEAGYRSLNSDHEGAATAMAFDAVVASIEFGDVGYGCN